MAQGIDDIAAWLVSAECRHHPLEAFGSERRAMKTTLKPALKILLGASFIVAGLNHFRDPPFYLRMMPDHVPAHALMVQLSGVTEIIAGTMMFIPRASHWGARFIVAHRVVRSQSSAASNCLSGDLAPEVQHAVAAVGQE